MEKIKISKNAKKKYNRIINQIRISTHDQNWNEFNLKKGYLFGQDANGLWVCTNPHARKIILYRTHKNGWYPTSVITVTQTHFNIKQFIKENKESIPQITPDPIYKGLESMTPQFRKIAQFKHYIGESKHKHNDFLALN